MNQFYNLMLVMIFSLFFIIDTCFSQVLFTKRIIDDNYDGACAIYAVDVDGDSLVDVLAAAWEANTLAWWKNNGGIPVNWTKNVIDNSFNGASYIFAKDVDGDGDIDVLGSAWDDNELAWWRNEGGNPIQWTKETITNDFINAHEIYAADIDGDFDIDILGAAAGSHEISLWLNDGGSPIIWTKQIVGQNFYGARSVYAAHIDQDTLVDVIGAAFSSDDIRWWQNTGGDPIIWIENTIDGNFDGAHKVLTYDVDGDNDEDVLGAAYIDNEIAVWFNDLNNQGQWIKQTIGENFHGALSVFAADIDGDGNCDVLGTADVDNDIAMWLNDGTFPINWIEYTIDNSFFGAWPVYAADIDNDDDIDILGSAYYADDVAWWENNSTVGVEGINNQPQNFSLMQNFPNPFNPSTNIKFSVPSNSFVSLKVFNVLGKEVAELVSEELIAGQYKVNFNAINFASGVYFYQLKADSYSVTKKMLLLK